MENNEIMNVNENGEIIDAPISENPLDVVPNVTVEQFRTDAFRGSLSQLASWAHEDGNSDAVLHGGRQLKTDHIINRVLTIIAAQYAYVPDENGRQKRYPVVVFAEAPDYWYNMGQLGSNLIRDWAKRIGDNPEENPYLPRLNQELTDCGGVRIHFRWKQGKNRPYVAITIA